jgi:WD40-like Beta Propeller Repeat
MSRAAWEPTARNGWRTMLVALALASAACDTYDLPTRPDYGFVRAVVTTTGGDLDADGYSVLLDNSQFQLVKDTAITSFYVRSGEHTVSLTALADNCTVTGPASQKVSVEIGQVTSVTFDVVCLATGIAVTARTVGPDSPDNIRIVVDGGQSVLVAANGAKVIGRLTPGTHQLLVTPPANCTVAGGNGYTLAVATMKVTDVALDVSCTAAVRLPKIAYAAYEIATGGRWIEVVNVDGTGKMRLQAGDAPSWSADGKRIAFSDASCPDSTSFYYYYSCYGGIIVADPELGDTTRLIGGADGAHPSWSPTGDKIVFHNLVSAPDLVLDVLGTLDHALARVTIAGPRSTSQPAWSPDGARIAFVCEWPTYPDICVANADGTAPTHLTDDQQVDQEPAWSPDGTKLAFARYPVGAYNAANASVAVMDLATRQFTLIGAGANPAWSPDGAKLVVEGTDGLFVMNADGSGRTRLTTGEHYAPAWRP